jgi:hypothetical protein
VLFRRLGKWVASPGAVRDLTTVWDINATDEQVRRALIRMSRFVPEDTMNTEGAFFGAGALVARSAGTALNLPFQKFLPNVLAGAGLRAGQDKLQAATGSILRDLQNEESQRTGSRRNPGG